MIPEIEHDELEMIEEPSKTWRLDLANNRIGGTIDELESVAQSAMMTLQTPRFKYLIFSWQYGSELDTLIGKDHSYAFSEAKRMITDALSTDTRITGVRDFAMQGDVIRFTIDTIFGSRQVGLEVTT